MVKALQGLAYPFYPPSPPLASVPKFHPFLDLGSIWLAYNRLWDNLTIPRNRLSRKMTLEKNNFYHI